LATANDPIIYVTNGFVLRSAIEGPQPTTIAADNNDDALIEDASSAGPLRRRRSVPN
jgi:hypothetical protein